VSDNLFVFKKENEDNWQKIYTKCERLQLRCLNGAYGKQDYQVEIKLCNKRSKKALSAYWMLIDVIVKWDSTENGLNKRYFHDMFMKEAGLVEEDDLMPGWRMRYRSELSEGLLINEESGSYHLFKPDLNKSKESWEYYHRDEYLSVYLGERYIEKTRSIANKGDVTKLEMEKLIFCILDFGKPDNNNIPGCEIRDDDLSRLLKFYEG